MILLVRDPDLSVISPGLRIRNAARRAVELRNSLAVRGVCFSILTGAHLSSPSSAPVAVVVEDEWLVRMEMADALSAAGWRVIESATGEDALDLLKTDQSVRLLITDIRLPGPVTGWDVAEKFREARPDVIVIYCSGNSLDEGRKLRDSVFLPKPCQIDLLLKNLPGPASA